MSTYLQDDKNTGVTPEPAKSTNYDTQPPPALLEFMLKEWKPRPGKPPPAIKDAKVFHARPRALSAAFPGETLIIPTGHEKVRSNDTLYRFRPGTEFYYLTGGHEPDCVLVMTPRPEGGHEDVLMAA